MNCTEAYRILRRVEHRLQMMADEQTYTLPETGRRSINSRGFWALRTGTASPVFLRKLARVQEHYGRLFEIDRYGKLPRAQLMCRPPKNRGSRTSAGARLQATRDGCGKHAQWLDGSYRALKDDTTRRGFAEFCRR